MRTRTERVRGARVGWAGAAALVAVASLSLVSPIHASARSHPGPAPAGPQVVAVEDDGEAVWERARDAKRDAYRQQGEAREAGLLEAARLFGQAAAHVDLPDARRSEAAFRAGELWRARTRVPEAEASFREAVRLGEASADGEARSFGARGLLELAHLRRRADAVEEALETYAAVGARFPAQARAVAHATTWTGKVLLAQGRLSDAAIPLGEFADRFPQYPLEAVRNAARLAEAYREAGQEDRAQELVRRLTQALQPLLDDGGSVAEEVADALAALRDTVDPSGYWPPQGG